MDNGILYLKIIFTDRSYPNIHSWLVLYPFLSQYATILLNHYPHIGHVSWSLYHDIPPVLSGSMAHMTQCWLNPINFDGENTDENHVFSSFTMGNLGYFR